MSVEIEGAENSDEIVWSVIHCFEDDSHALVDKKEIMYQEPLECDDVVHFYFLNENGKKKKYQGKVMGLSKDYRAMLQLQDSLNKETRPKREPSFHEGQPRKAKVACQDKLKKEKVQVPKKVRKIVSSSDSDESESKQDGKVNTSNTADTDPESSDDGSVSSLTDGEYETLQQLSKKVKAAEEKQLKKLSQKGSQASLKDSTKADAIVSSLDSSKKQSSFVNVKLPTGSKNSNVLKGVSGLFKGGISFTSNDTKKSSVLNSNLKPTINELRSKDTNKKPIKLKDNVNSDTASSSKDSDNLGSKDVEGEKTEEVPLSQNKSVEVKRVILKRGAKRSQREVTLITFTGESLTHSASELNVKLCENYDNVYIPEKTLKRLKNTCGSASVLTRRLTREVFSSVARETCSVSGKPSMVKGAALPEVRTPLNQDGVNAIIEFVKSRAEKKKWQVPSDVAIKQVMANMLCEERKAIQLEAEAKLEEEREKAKKAAEQQEGDGQDDVQ